MAKHYFVWNPREDPAYRGDTAEQGKLRARHAQCGKPPTWVQMQVDGWGVAEIELPTAARLPVEKDTTRAANPPLGGLLGKGLAQDNGCAGSASGPSRRGPGGRGRSSG